MIIAAVLLLNNIWTLYVWKDRSAAFIVVMSLVLLAASWVVLFAKKRTLLVLYIAVIMEWNGMAVYKHTALFYQTPPSDSINAQIFILTHHARNSTISRREQTNAVIDWINDDNYLVYTNRDKIRHRYEVDDLYADFLLHTRTYKHDYFVVVEDVAKPLRYNWRYVLARVVQNAMLNKLDVVFLDHEAYLRSRAVPALNVSGSSVMLYRRSSLIAIANYIRRYTMKHIDLYETVIWRACEEKILLCDFMPLFKETGTRPLLSIDKI